MVHIGLTPSLSPSKTSHYWGLWKNPGEEVSRAGTAIFNQLLFDRFYMSTKDDRTR